MNPTPSSPRPRRISAVQSSLPLLLAALGCFVPSSALSAADPPARPNIVLFVVDDMSPDTGAYGHTIVKTPHLDALAADARLFTHAYATTASCSASRSVILTGLHNHANGQYGHQHDYHGFAAWKNVRSLPVMLEECGYRTARIGKLHVAPDEVFRFQEQLPGDSRHTVAMAENCRDLIHADDDRPFFLYFATTDPHRGGGVDRTSPLRPDLFGNLPEGRAREGLQRIDYDPAAIPVPSFLPDTPETRAELAHYLTAVSRIDQGVGRLIDILREAGKWEDTLFIFTADHGMAFAGAKTTVYEPGLRIPFILRHPGLTEAERRGRIDAMVSLVDLTPTLLDVAGGYDPAANSSIHPDSRDLGPPQPGENRGKPWTGFHGRSFLPLLAGEAPAEGWDRVHASHTFHEIQMYYPMRVVRERKHKLIWNIAWRQPFPFASDLWAAASWQAQYRSGMEAPYGRRSVGSYIQRPEFELYDLEADPDEATNLAGDSRHADLLRRLQQELRAFQELTADPWIMKWEYE